MSSWPLSTVEALCSRVTSGGTPSRSKPEYYEPGEYLWVKSKELIDRPIAGSEEMISGAGLNGSSAKVIRPDSVLMAMYGANVGQLGWLEVAATVNQAICAMETDPEMTDGRWLFYALRHWRSALTSQAHGAAQQNLSQSLIRQFAIPTPPLRTQNKIAAALAAYDNLIENNTRRIEILEEMARAIYREWFVELRYPDHEDVRLVDSTTGPIPDDWAAVPLRELVSTQYGYTESAQDDPVGPRYLRGMDINKTSYIDWSLVPYCPIGENDLDKFRIHEGDVFVIRMADPGKVGICEIDVDAVFASYLVRISPVDDRLLPYFLYYTLAADRYQGWVTGASTGATRKSVSAKVMVEPSMVLPTIEVQQQFDSVIRPLRRLLNSLLAQNAKLAETRDLLLPKLVSGEIDVSELELPEAV